MHDGKLGGRIDFRSRKGKKKKKSIRGIGPKLGNEKNTKQRHLGGGHGNVLCARSSCNTA